MDTSMKIKIFHGVSMNTPMESLFNTVILIKNHRNYVQNYQVHLNAKREPLNDHNVSVRNVWL